MPGCVTYYTSLLPGSFKQYSTPFDSFWCCVGTGMENHSKYAESIYFKDNQELLVNLYIPSRLHWKEKEADFGYLFPGVGYGYSKDG